MTRPRTLALALPLALLLALSATLPACSLVGSEGPPAGPGGLLRTDRAAYDARLVTDGPDAIVFEVPFEVQNTTGRPLYLVGCLRPPKPLLEKLDGGGWVTAYAAGEPGCLSPPFVIGAGEVRRDTLRVYGHLPGQNTSPEFRTGVGAG